MEMWAITQFRDGHEFLSNFSPSPIKLGGLVFPTVEHAYQAAKTVNPAEREAISRIAGPGDAKKFGKTVEIRYSWDEIKLTVMTNLIQIKFRDATLARQLKATEGSKLVEGNAWHDLYWGMCYCKMHDFSGANHLGEILMKERDKLR